MTKRYHLYEDSLCDELKQLKEKVHQNEIELLKQKLNKLEEEKQLLQLTNQQIMIDNMYNTPLPLTFPWGNCSMPNAQRHALQPVQPQHAQPQQRYRLRTQLTQELTTEAPN